MRAGNIKRADDWNDAYQGNRVGLSLSTTRRNAPRRKVQLGDLSDFKKTLFYILACVLATSYFYYLNQDRIERLFVSGEIADRVEQSR